MKEPLTAEKVRGMRNYVTRGGIPLEPLADSHELLRAQRDEAWTRVAGLEAILANTLQEVIRFSCDRSCVCDDGPLGPCRRKTALAALSADPLKVGEAVGELARQVNIYDSRDNEVDTGLLRSHVIFAARALSAAMKGSGR